MVPLFIAAPAALSAAAARPVDAAQVERLMAALPESATKAVDAAEEASRLVRLAALNPGRRDEIKAILDAENECAAAEDRKAVRTILSAVAADLGKVKIERLIAFYGSPHYPALRALAHRASQGGSLSAEERSELERAEAAYPLREFELTRHAKIKALVAAGRGPDYRRCANDGDAALARAGLRRE